VWLVAHGATRAPCRFDVVSVVILPGAPPAIAHIPNAFET
jgi:Holliday junction resolvase-like predicted endonuclease